MTNPIVTLEPARACAQCRFMKREQLQGQINRVMVCHRMPPTVSMVMVPPQRPGMPAGIQGITQFPLVQPTMWCYEFEKEDVHGPREVESLTDAGRACEQSDIVPPGGF